MRRKRKNRRTLEVSLFPFLAVLICTIGVLIVMLVMAAKSADVEAKTAQSDDDNQRMEEVESLQRSLDLSEIRLVGIENARADVLARVQNARAGRSHLQDQIRELKDEFRRVGDELIQLKNQEAELPQAIEDFQADSANLALAKLRSQIEKTKTDLESKRSEVVNSGPLLHKIVPYHGNHGTLRRPIFLECTKDGVVFQPSGIRILKSEFVDSPEPGNMIDSALLAIREYWQRYDLTGEHGSPYPLIIVRPEGAESFVLARSAMKSWDDEFGYELVDESKALDFGTKDEQLNSEIESAIAEARQKYRFKLAQKARALRSGSAGFRQTQSRGTAGPGGQPSRRGRFETPDSRPGLTVSSPMGGFVSNQNETVQAATALEQYGLKGHGADGVQNAFSASNSRQTSSGQTNSGNQQGSNHSGSYNQQANQSTNLQSKQQSSSRGGATQSLQPSIAGKKGKDWALPARTPGATGYLRPIRVVCHADHLMIHSSAGAPVKIPMLGSTEDAMGPLVNEVWRQIDSWGISGAQGYWKPQLRFTTQPNAETRYQEIKSLLFQSGLIVEKSQ
jgi:biopolymer transport protein ExbD